MLMLMSMLMVMVKLVLFVDVDVACMLTWYAAFVHICLERFQPLFSSFIQPQTCAITFVWSPPFSRFFNCSARCQKKLIDEWDFPMGCSVTVSAETERCRSYCLIGLPGTWDEFYKFYGEEHLLTKGWMCVIDNILCLQYSSFLSNIPWVQRWSVTRLLAAVLAGSRHLVLAHTDGLVASPGSNLLTGRVFWLVVAS